MSQNLTTQPPTSSSSWTLVTTLHKDLYEGTEDYILDYTLPSNFPRDFAKDTHALIARFRNQSFEWEQSELSKCISCFISCTVICICIFPGKPLEPTDRNFYIEGWESFLQKAEKSGWTVAKRTLGPPLLCRLQKSGYEVDFRANWRKHMDDRSRLIWDNLQHPTIKRAIGVPQLIVTRIS
ncbi:hypothetical protein HDV00_007388 [Rhizophlyctis rosea]|nr:hypothetical protein HDV00_007388 [Rhizophlyctis rosea]